MRLYGPPESQRQQLADAIDGVRDRLARLEAAQLVSVDFGSDDALEAARELGLTAQDFEGVEPAGETGYLVAQVREIAAGADDDAEGAEE